jgi:hypothetical protein
MSRRVAGRPERPSRDLAAHRRRSRSRCHRNTVSGLTSNRNPARRALGITPASDDAAEHFDDGDLIVLAGAYAGEVLRSFHGGGSWVLGPDGPIKPVHLSVGPPGNEIAVNVLGKVRRYLQHGSADSVHTLARAVSSYLAGE